MSCATRDDEPRLVWTSLRLSAHHAPVNAREREIFTVCKKEGARENFEEGEL